MAQISPDVAALLGASVGGGLYGLVHSWVSNKRAKKAAESQRLIEHQVVPPVIAPTLDERIAQLAHPSLHAKVDEIKASLTGLATKDHIINLDDKLTRRAEAVLQRQDRLEVKVDHIDAKQDDLVVQVDHAINQRGELTKRVQKLEEKG